MTHFIPNLLLKKHPFILFGPMHLATMAIIIIIITTLVSFVKIVNNNKLSYKFACGIAIFSAISYLMAAFSCFKLIHHQYLKLLPLQLCSLLSLILIPAALIKRQKKIFEICYYIGLGGSLQAIITPNLHYSTPFIASIFYYSEHAAIVLGVIYCLLIYNMKPQKGSVVRTWGTINLYCFTMMGINYLLGTNFCYTWHKPHGTNLITKLSPWPWYIPEVSMIALLIFSCLYLPFYFRRLYLKQNTIEAAQT